MNLENNFKLIDNKKHPQLIKDGFVFNFDISATKSSKKCEKFYRCSTIDCKSRIIVKNDQIVRNFINHNHDHHRKKIVKNKFLKLIKDCSKIEDSASTVYNKILSSSFFKNKEDLSNIPTFNSVKSTINKHKSSNFPKEPLTIDQLKINADYIVDNYGEHFLQLLDTDCHKLAVFFLDSKLELLASADIVVVDGTFKTAPKLFKQVFTMHVVLQNHCIPIVYALLSNKKRSSYTKVLEVVQSRCDYLGINFKPNKIYSDYEIAIMKSFKNVFGIQVQGCWFHFVQTIYKNISKHGLNKFYKQPNFNKLILMLFNLPLIPPNLVNFYFNVISKELKVISSNVSSFLNYFHSTWISNKARYPINVWSHYKDTFRSNSCLEG